MGLCARTKQSLKFDPLPEFVKVNSTITSQHRILLLRRNRLPVKIQRLCLQYLTGSLQKFYLAEYSAQEKPLLYFFYLSIDWNALIHNDISITLWIFQNVWKQSKITLHFIHWVKFFFLTSKEAQHREERITSQRGGWQLARLLYQTGRTEATPKGRGKK